MIIIDSRESPEIKKHADRVSLLPRGDAWIVANERVVRIERKTLPDMYNSLISDRLNRQLSRVDELHIQVDSNLPQNVFRLLFNDHKLIKILNGLNEKIVCKYVIGYEGYISNLRLIENKLKTGVYATMRVHATIDTGYDDMRIGMISCIPGIGEEGAKNILDTYGTVLNSLFNCHKWDEIKGIGEKTVDKCIRFLTTKREKPMVRVKNG